MSISFGLRGLAIGGALVYAVAMPRSAAAQGGATPPATAPTPNPFAPATKAKRVPISKAVFGDAGIIVNARDDGFVEVAAAGPKKTIFLQMRTLAARAWVDSTSRMMKARAKKADPERTYRSDISEFGTSTTMSMTRTVSAGTSQFALAFTENPESSFTIPIEPEEADVFVAIMRKAVTQSAKMLEKTDTTAAAAARADSVARADSIAAAKKKRAARRAASPPAVKDSTAKKDSTKTAIPKVPAPKP